MALSDTWLKANNGRERAALEERSDRDGLGVRLTPNGKITYQLRYRCDWRAAVAAISATFLNIAVSSLFGLPLSSSMVVMYVFITFSFAGGRTTPGATTNVPDFLNPSKDSMIRPLVGV
ncbi:MAG: Arm DNA-binding domain-containing protein [Caldimonas sp.]